MLQRYFILIFRSVLAKGRGEERLQQLRRVAGEETPAVVYGSWKATHKDRRKSR